MKLYPVNPLALAGAYAGMNRPLNKYDFPHWKIPARIGEGIARRGIIRSILSRWGQEHGMANMNILIGGAAAGQDSWNTNVVTTVQRHPLGTLAMSADGRMFRYGSVGATDGVVGSIYQSAAPIANHLALTSVAQAIGDGASPQKPIVVTPGATAGAAGLYGDGTLVIDTTPGNGYSYRIAGHAAITASTAFNLFLYPDETIQIALTSASRYGLHHSPWKTVIVAATTVTALACGGMVTVITGNGTSENFGWLQTRGEFAALINGTPGVGIGVVTSATTAGAVDVAAVAAEINVRIIGRMMQVGVSGKNNSVYLTLD